MHRVLVTGGAGFIGSHLCRSLVDKGYHVTCLDNFFTGRRSNIRQLIDNKMFTIVPHDITNPLPSGLAVDDVYNLACPASPVHYQFDPIETVKAGTVGVVNVLEFAKINGARVLQASTSEIYGDPTEHPQTEAYRGNVNTLGPRACYDESKRVAETLFMDYHRKYGLDTRIVRIFNTYGPNMDSNDGRVVSNFIVASLSGKPLKIYGDGSQTRSFCYVADLVRGMVSVMERQDSPMPFNLGNPDERTVYDIALLVQKLTGSDSQISYESLPADDPTRRKPDIARAMAVLGWQPETQLEDGLAETIRYFKSSLGQKKSTT